MPKKSTIATLLVSTAAAGLAGAVIAGAKDSTTATTSGTTPQSTTPQGYGHRGGPGGTGGFGGHRGHGGPGRGGFGFGAEAAAVAKSLGVTEAELKKAVEAARPDKPKDADKTKGKDARIDEAAAALAKELGESTADVKSVIESLKPAAGDHPKRGERPPTGTTPPKGDKPTGTTPPAGRPGPGGPGRGGFFFNDDALVSALAKKFSISEDKAQAAVDAVRKASEAERDAKQDEFFAAVGKSLGKSADDVKKAFEAARPTPPAKPTK